MENVKMSFVSRMSNFFGRLPNQSTPDFGKELKNLTYRDKLDLVEQFNAAGLPTDAPKEPTDAPKEEK